MVKCDSDLCDEIEKVLECWNDRNSNMNDREALDKIFDIMEQR